MQSMQKYGLFDFVLSYGNICKQIKYIFNEYKQKIKKCFFNSSKTRTKKKMIKCLSPSMPYVSPHVPK